MFTSPKLSILYLGKKNFDLVTKNLLTDSDLSQGTDKLLCMGEFCVILIAGTTCQVQFMLFFGSQRYLLLFQSFICLHLW